MYNDKCSKCGNRLDSITHYRTCIITKRKPKLKKQIHWIDVKLEPELPQKEEEKEETNLQFKGSYVIVPNSAKSYTPTAKRLKELEDEAKRIIENLEVVQFT